MFRPLLIHYKVYTSCLGAEFFFLNPYFEYDYVTCNVMLCNKTPGIIYFLVQLYRY
jgi:hypothetical protein